MPFIIAGIVLAVAAIGLSFGARRQRRKLGQMRAAQTAGAAELSELSAAVAKDIGAGSFNQVTEVKGTIECGSPLVSELSQTPCVRYSMSVTREYEESYWERDDKGNQVQRTRRGSESVAANARSVPFQVRDATGSIEVDPEGASFVDEKVFSRFEQGGGTSFRFGGFSLDAGGFMSPGGRRTIGYRFEESAIPVGRQVYVLGEAVDSGGRLRVARPQAKGAAFIVSLKSEEELAKGAGKAATAFTVGAVVAALLAAGALVYGIVSGA
jgi:hypothetical protein